MSMADAPTKPAGNDKKGLFRLVSSDAAFPYNYYFYSGGILDHVEERELRDHIDDLAYMADISPKNYRIFSDLHKTEVCFRNSVDHQNFLAAIEDAYDSKSVIRLEFAFSASKGIGRVSSRAFKKTAETMARTCEDRGIGASVEISADKRARTISLVAATPEIYIDLWVSLSKTRQEILRRSHVKRHIA